ncbi:hypothetical protein BKA70DRAFT_1272759 [Coprinopsis sp. MPI-PUGE-AT-0042]|nr:hypothetical protein BKA70DRAFT_1272759 [Coprinopsis sp. MPI-PUGE-AT-0042]
MDLQSSIDALLRWCASQGFDIDARLQICRDAHGGIGVYTNQYGTEIEPGETVVKIPKNAVLSSRNCVLSEFLEPLRVGLEAQLTLGLALYSELLLEKSKWFGYLQSLPQVPELPLTTASDRDCSTAWEWLEGTEARRLLDRKGEDGETLLETITDFYRLTAEPLLRGHTDLGFTDHISFPGFIRAFCLVCSRSFLVDRFHGLAMVPIADAFNHVQDNHVHIESDFEVCHECGSTDECPHDRGDEAELGKDSSEKTAVFFEMVANTLIPRSTEVFNTYGETLSNAQLLTRYGFILDANENDCVTWSFEEVFNDLDVNSRGPVEGGNGSMGDNIMKRVADLFKDPHFLSSANASGVLVMHGSEESTVIGPRKSNILFIDSDGKASVGLWLTLILIAGYSEGRPFQTYNLDGGLVVKEMMELLDVFTTMTGDGASGIPPEFAAMFFGSMDKNYLRKINTQSQFLVRLCEKRKRSTGKPGVDDEQIGEIMDSLDENHKRTRDALSIVLSERAILGSCQETWNEFVGLLTTIL